jgi:hypothetical protein
MVRIRGAWISAHRRVVHKGGEIGVGASVAKARGAGKRGTAGEVVNQSAVVRSLMPSMLDGFRRGTEGRLFSRRGGDGHRLAVRSRMKEEAEGEGGSSQRDSAIMVDRRAVWQGGLERQVLAAPRKML